jgi:hypothetical protein
MWLSSELPPNGDEYRIGIETQKEEVASRPQRGGAIEEGACFASTLGGFE